MRGLRNTKVSERKLRSFNLMMKPPNYRGFWKFLHFSQKKKGWPDAKKKAWNKIFIFHLFPALLGAYFLFFISTNQPIKWRQLIAFKHLDMAEMTCWSSNRKTCKRMHHVKYVSQRIKAARSREGCQNLYWYDVSNKVHSEYICKVNNESSAKDNIHAKTNAGHLIFENEYALILTSVFLFVITL